MGKKHVLALIPARGGSKGIPNKNIVDLAGHPLVWYVIDAAKRSGVVEKIVCTTDSEEVRKVAISCGAEAPFLRPIELATDESATYPALMHAVQTYESMTGFKPDYIVTLQPTYPLVQPAHIQEAVDMAIEREADSVITAVELDHDCHPYNIREQLPDGTIHFWKEDEHYAFPTRQSKPTFYKFGNVFVSSYNTLMQEGKLEGKHNFAVFIDPLYAADVNTPEDLQAIARILTSR